MQAPSLVGLWMSTTDSALAATQDAVGQVVDTPWGFAAAIVLPLIGAGVWSLKLIVNKLLERADSDRNFMLAQIQSERDSLKATIATLQSFVHSVSAESASKTKLLEELVKGQNELREGIAKGHDELSEKLRREFREAQQNVCRAKPH